MVFIARWKRGSDYRARATPRGLIESECGQALSTRRLTELACGLGSNLSAAKCLGRDLARID